MERSMIIFVLASVLIAVTLTTVQQKYLASAISSEVLIYQFMDNVTW